MVETPFWLWATGKQTCRADPYRPRCQTQTRWHILTVAGTKTEENKITWNSPQGLCQFHPDIINQIESQKITEPLRLQDEQLFPFYQKCAHASAVTPLSCGPQSLEGAAADAHR